MGGQDALNLTYAYWRNVNQHAGQPTLLVFVGLNRRRGGAGPSLYEVDKATDAVTPRGPLFPPDHALSQETAEGWYWSATDPAVLYCSDDEHLYRWDVTRQVLETVVDIVPFRWLGKFALRQWHSSADGTVHSATVKLVVEDGAYPSLGTVIYDEKLTQPWRWFPRIGPLDESQVDPSGAWLLIKETLPPEATPGVVRPKHDEDNRIIGLADGEERFLLDEHGAAGHSDSGFGYMVAADNWYPDLGQPAAWRVWMFAKGQAPFGRLVYYSRSWATQVNHVSHGNARPGPPDRQFVVGSGATRATGPRANEIIAFPLDGSFRVLVIAPCMVDLDAPGGGVGPDFDYTKLPKGNLDVTGDYFFWPSNCGGNRLDAFLVKVPGHLLA